VEGVISLVLAPLAYFWVPNSMDTAWFLNKEQRRQALVRYEMNKVNYNQDEKFRWSEVKRAVLSWTVSLERYCSASVTHTQVFAAGTVQFCADITLYGISTFM
jgi:hypothetical protein